VKTAPGKCGDRNLNCNDGAGHPIRPPDDYRGVIHVWRGTWLVIFYDIWRYLLSLSDSHMSFRVNPWCPWHHSGRNDSLSSNERSRHDLRTAHILVSAWKT
jgi:hypothetical protein